MIEEYNRGYVSNYNPTDTLTGSLYAELYEELLKANYWNGLIKFGFGAMTVFAAVGSLIVTAGTDAPVAIAAITYVAEGGFLAYGVSEMYEGNEQAWYAACGDVHSVAFNPIRDTLFGGNQTAYDIWGMASGIATSMMMPVVNNYPQVGHLSNEISSGGAASSVANIADDVGEIVLDIVNIVIHKETLRKFYAFIIA